MRVSTDTKDKSNFSGARDALEPELSYHGTSYPAETGGLPHCIINSTFSDGCQYLFYTRGKRVPCSVVQDWNHVCPTVAISSSLQKHTCGDLNKNGPTGLYI